MVDNSQFVFVERKKALQIAATCGLGVIYEEAELQGYQTYIVEQWVCDRNIASNTVKVFTGDQSHKIKVCVISITAADRHHPRPEIQSFFDTGTPVKLKSTPLGEIMLTDPSEFPCDMDMVLVPDGDYEKWISQAYVNINLRRSNCTGRSALNLRKPNPASEEKFRSIYKVADVVNFENAVIDLVTLAQVALYLFGLLRKDYIDGLICNETTTALWEFYTKYNPHKSPDYQVKEPCWMEPHLLTALITKLIVCRNKLQAYNYTTIKDPFADYEAFRFDIDEYQRVKGLKRTKFIDLETLEKLNENTIGQLKMRNVIKSKLDDISGINNSPLFNEASDPEIFRHHATLGSLRVIWRPRLKNPNGTDQDRQPYELIHMIKGVSARTTRTSGAAAEILTKAARSLPWVSTTDHRRNKSRQRKIRRNRSVFTQSPGFRSGSSSGKRELDYEPGVSSPKNLFAGRQPSPLTSETYLSSDDDMYAESYRSDSEVRSWRLSPEQFDQDIPTYVRSTSPYASKENSRVASPVTAERTDIPTTNQDYINGCNSAARPHRVPRRNRAVSDSAVPTLAVLQPSGKREETFVAQRTRSISLINIVDNNREVDLRQNHELHEQQQHMLQHRRSTYMDVKTYVFYEKLRRQQLALHEAYVNMKKMAQVYEDTANQLRVTYQRRSKEFEQIQRNARQVMEEQHDTDKQLKHVEDNSAKLHYELNVLNEYLKDIEDNVCAFYRKVDLLERKMDDSQQSITTMLIIGNYFNHYWQKVKRWIGWSEAAIQ
ncbi:hypothetical protein EC973_008272 [Apophysomyces ossiformis]|uniref:STB6-like N-terminal domain-containing protein n=1 Tax=Apophysomyces ossiformis TaxID=679940 RepID=A0A8H7EUB6_9FUNG|nr:hypothetical protein EC973_008272 [Apophysomyces ossiformis]